MNNSILAEIKESFKKGSSLTKLIYINLGVFLVVKLLFVVYFLFNPETGGYAIKEALFQRDFLGYLMLPSDLGTFIFRPWTIISYMFLHSGFIHLLFNMLVLFWFGRIFQRYLTDKQLVTTYLLGGIFGAVLIFVFYYLFPGLHQFLGIPTLGASAAVMAIVLAISAYNPEYSIHLMFFGPVKLKYVAIVYIVLDVIMIASDNSGGHIAHLGGALYGYLFAVRLKKGKDTGRGFSRFIDGLFSLFKRQPKMKVAYKSQAKQMTDMDYNKSKVETQKEVDRILDKIAKSGYDSLSKKEKETLFRMSDK